MKTSQNILRALPPVLGGMIWFAMMLYLLISYCTIPRLADGALPRIGLEYAKYPFISSIGVLHMSVFEGSAIIAAIMMATGYGIDYHVHRDLKPGSVFRVPKLAAVALSAVFLVALSFVNINYWPQLHLAFTSIQITVLGLAKLFGFLQNHCLLRAAPECLALKMGQRYRTVVAVIAFPSWTMLGIGIYGCQGPVATLPSTAACFKIVTVAAPAEWILSITFILLLFTIGYDNYKAEEIREAIIFYNQVPLKRNIQFQNSQESLVISPSKMTAENVEEKEDNSSVEPQEELLQI